MQRTSETIGRRIARLETARGLPGHHAASFNRVNWDQHDWKNLGEEWTVSDAWKESLIHDVMRVYLTPGGTVLEIGPGAGRWSVHLRSLADQLILVDVSPRCIEICRERLGEGPDVEYHVTSGTDLEFIADDSVDGIWSFDVFVHIAPTDTERYLRQFARILKPGGRGVVHHPAEGGHYGGWRTQTTTDFFAEFVGRAGLELVRQFDRWGASGEFDVRAHRDAITVFSRPS